MTLHTPVDGTVQVIVGEIGEAIVPGRALLVITAPDSQWFQFNVREDGLDGIDVGASVSLLTTAAESIPGRVTRLERLGDFATWRAASTVGDHDLNTFAVRAEPTASPVNELRPGMTVWLARR